MKKKNFIIYLLLFIFSFLFIKNVSAVSTCTYEGNNLDIKFTIDGTVVTVSTNYTKTSIGERPSYKEFIKNGIIECPDQIYAAITGQNPNDETIYSYSFTNKSNNILFLKSNSLSSTCTYEDEDGKIGISFVIEDGKEKVKIKNTTEGIRIDDYPKFTKDFYNNGKVECKPLYAIPSDTTDTFGITGYSFTFEYKPSYIQMNVKNSVIGNNKPPVSSNSNGTSGTQTNVGGYEIDPIDYCTNTGILKTLRIVGYAFFVLKILVPLILIVMATIDFAKAVISSDDKSNKDAMNKLIRRVIIGVIIFLIPSVLDFGFSVVDEAVDNMKTFEQCSTCLFDPMNCNP